MDERRCPALMTRGEVVVAGGTRPGGTGELLGPMAPFPRKFATFLDIRISFRI